MTFDEERALKIFDSMIQISVSGFKLLALLNGGAAVALLAYLGNISKVATTGASTAIASPDLRWPMFCYIMGLLFCGIAFGLSYRTQFLLWNETLGRTHKGMHRACLVGAGICCTLSLIAFGVGSFLAAVKFQ